MRTADRVDPKANPWKLQATLPGAVIHDISFASADIGYAAAELGQVWKTVNGGATWKEIMNLQFPYYWYGVKALTAKDVVVAGFNDNALEGILRWSHDGGKTWTDDVVLTTTGWSFRVRFANKNDGLVLDGLNTQAANAAHVTTDGGAQASDWTENVPDPNGGWFGNQFSLLSNLHARASGITYCTSKNGGAQWKCRPSIDSVFDGPTFFLNDTFGWVGGGEIAPNVAGWVHQTANGGKTWSGRSLNSPLANPGDTEVPYTDLRLGGGRKLLAKHRRHVFQPQRRQDLVAGRQYRRGIGCLRQEESGHEVSSMVRWL